MANATPYALQIGNVLYGGIDSSIPGHGGEKCLQYLDRNLMVLDTAIGMIYNLLSWLLLYLYNIYVIVHIFHIL